MRIETSVGVITLQSCRCQIIVPVEIVNWCTCCNFFEAAGSCNTLAVDLSRNPLSIFFYAIGDVSSVSITDLSGDERKNAESFIRLRDGRFLTKEIFIAWVRAALSTLMQRMLAMASSVRQPQQQWSVLRIQWLRCLDDRRVQPISCIIYACTWKHLDSNYHVQSTLYTTTICK